MPLIPLDADKYIFDVFFSLKEKEEYSAAFDVLLPMVEKYPEEGELHFLLGAVLYLDDDYRQADGYLRKAVSLEPEYWMPSITLVLNLTRLDKWHTAFNELERFLSIKEGDKKEHLFLLQELSEEINNFRISERAFISRIVKRFKNDLDSSSFDELAG
jgi:tetratricopeptide (TPR) repeat protein